MFYENPEAAFAKEIIRQSGLPKERITELLEKDIKAIWQTEDPMHWRRIINIVYTNGTRESVVLDWHLPNLPKKIL